MADIRRRDGGSIWVAVHRCTSGKVRCGTVLYSLLAGTVLDAIFT